MSSISSVLGGRKALGSEPQTFADWADAIHEGLSVQSAQALRDLLAIPGTQFAALLGVSEKTLSRARVGGARLDAVVSDRLYRVARVAALAIDALEGKRPAINWLKRSQIGLGRRVPLDLLTTDAGRAEVEKLLLRVEHGVYT